MSENIKLMQGNEAIAEGAMAAGCDFFAGYPMGAKGVTLPLV